MLVLLAAATVVTGPPMVERTPNLYRVPAGCADARRRVVDRFGRPVPVLLGDLPNAAPILLVNRTINGCPVITVMRGAPPAAPDEPNPPASAYRLHPLDKPAPGK